VAILQHFKESASNCQTIQKPPVPAILGAIAPRNRTDPIENHRDAL
jgi:hypothetical protein